jgi:hypothetical protein
MTKEEPQDFLLGISFDLVEYDDNDNQYVNRKLQEFLEAVSIPIDILKINEFYFQQEVGTGDVYVFNISQSELFVIELYRGLHDQCDIVTIGLRVTSKNLRSACAAMRSLYDHAHFMVSYSQSWKLEKLDELVNYKNYPRDIESYSQKIHLNHDIFMKNLI